MIKFVPGVGWVKDYGTEDAFVLGGPEQQAREEAMRKERRRLYVEQQREAQKQRFADILSSYRRANPNATGSDAFGHLISGQLQGLSDKMGSAFGLFNNYMTQASPIQGVTGGLFNSFLNRNRGNEK